MDKFIRSSIQALLMARAARRGGTPWRVMSPIQIQKIRKKLGLSQAQFSEAYGFELISLQSWEQGRRMPDPVNSILLELTSRYPTEMKVAVSIAEDRHQEFVERLELDPV